MALEGALSFLSCPGCSADLVLRTLLACKREDAFGLVDGYEHVDVDVVGGANAPVVAERLGAAEGVGDVRGDELPARDRLGRGGPDRDLPPGGAEGGVLL